MIRQLIQFYIWRVASTDSTALQQASLHVRNSPPHNIGMLAHVKPRELPPHFLD